MAFLHTHTVLISILATRRCLKLLGVAYLLYFTSWRQRSRLLKRVSSRNSTMWKVTPKITRPHNPLGLMTIICRTTDKWS